MLDSLLQQTQFSDSEIEYLLSLSSRQDCHKLQRAAYNLTTKRMGNNVYLRGLIEVSNICTANCRYCGIRKNNHTVTRYTLPEDVIINCAKIALQAGYGSIAIQAGERRDPKWIEWIAHLLRRIHEETQCIELPEGLGITLSLGEQSLETYQYWAEAAQNPTALRYLLRIESSNPKLFQHLHCTPGKNEKVLESRYRALENLRKAGYQVGTGVMIGLPNQTLQDLVQDIRTFQKYDADMIGMGPYLTSHGGDMIDRGQMPHDSLLQLTLNMIAVTRLVLRNVNIAAATALETLEKRGRILGIKHGCNVVMPNITPQQTRASYQLYDNKSGTEVGHESNILIEKDIVALAKRSLGLNLHGSSQHWIQRTKN